MDFLLGFLIASGPVTKISDLDLNQNRVLEKSSPPCCADSLLITFSMASASRSGGGTDQLTQKRKIRDVQTRGDAPHTPKKSGGVAKNRPLREPRCGL